LGVVLYILIVVFVFKPSGLLNCAHKAEAQITDDPPHKEAEEDKNKEGDICREAEREAAKKARRKVHNRKNDQATLKRTLRDKFPKTNVVFAVIGEAFVLIQLDVKNGKDACTVKWHGNHIQPEAGKSQEMRDRSANQVPNSPEGCGNQSCSQK